MPCLLVCLLLSAAHAQIATGGTYTLDQAVIAGGGGTSSGTGYSVDGTVGQNVTVVYLTGGAYSIRNGFWGAISTPTAATVVVSGRVVNQSGMGLARVRVSLMGNGLTSPRTAVTNPFGYFTLSDIEAGQTYIISVTSKHYGFGQNTQFVPVMDNITDLVFVSTWQN
jgi:hypothetical protein